MNIINGDKFRHAWAPSWQQMTDRHLVLSTVPEHSSHAALPASSSTFGRLWRWMGRVGGKYTPGRLRLGEFGKEALWRELELAL